MKRRSTTGIRRRVRQGYRVTVFVAGFYVLYFVASTWATAGSLPFADPYSGALSVLSGSSDFFTRLFGLSMLVVTVDLVRRIGERVDDDRWPDRPSSEGGG